MKTLVERAKEDLNLKQYNEHNKPDSLGKLWLDVPDNPQNILRMPFYTDGFGADLPEYLKWCIPLIKVANYYQRFHVSQFHNFNYLTVRCDYPTDSDWHVDGFSMNFGDHTPEQNYIWTNAEPTEFLGAPTPLPDDFDPSVHNIHDWFNRQEFRDCGVTQAEPDEVTCIDPYVVHRKPVSADGVTGRWFVRVSYIPLEIVDRNNYVNPLMGPNLTTRDGVKEVRDKLVPYE